MNKEKIDTNPVKLLPTRNKTSTNKIKSSRKKTVPKSNLDIKSIVDEDSWEGRFDETVYQEPNENDYYEKINNPANSTNVCIGIITWNVGNNINESKFSELIDSCNLDAYSPDILVIGLQEIPVKASINTRNSFLKQYNGINNILSKLHNKYTFIDELKQNTNNYTFRKKRNPVELFTCNNFISATFGGYGIATLVYKKKAFTQSVEITKVVKKCMNLGSGTKGWCAATLTVNYLHTIDILNCHMPFESISQSKSFSKQICDNLNFNQMKSQLQFIFGDLNSRSILTNDCYKKNIITCLEDDSAKEKKYCRLKHILENYSFEDSVKTYPSNSRLKIKQLTDSNCSINNRIAESRLADPRNGKFTESNTDDIIKILVQSDALFNSLKPKYKGEKWFPSFKESKITFLPTYKRDIKTGVISLIKESNNKLKGRLPGYADRIIYKSTTGKVENVSYNPLPIKGNDHVPLLGIYKFNLKNVTPAYGGKSVTKKNRTKKNRTKKICR